MGSAPATSGDRFSPLSGIGNTPLIQLRRVIAQSGAKVFLKLEYHNPTASYKDRMAIAVIEGAERSGALRPGMRVLEFTGGSTGSSLAMVCAVKGYKFIAVSSDAFAKEKLMTIRAFGGDLHIVPSDGGKITPEIFTQMKAETARLAGDPDIFYADQFNNPDVPIGYSGLGVELLDKLPTIDVFTASVGTGGMLVGVSRVLKAKNPNTRVIALEPASAPLLSQGTKGSHRVEGIGVGFVPPHLSRHDYDEAMAIEEGEARQMARALAKQEGVFAGTSTGLNVVAATKIAANMGPEQVVVTVAADGGFKYLAGDLYA